MLPLSRSSAFQSRIRTSWVSSSRSASRSRNRRPTLRSARSKRARGPGEPGGKGVGHRGRAGPQGWSENPSPGAASYLLSGQVNLPFGSEAEYATDPGRPPAHTSIHIAIGLLLGGGLLAACSSDTMSIYGNVSVDVAGHGSGNGTVYAPDPQVDIDCTFVAGSSGVACHDDFPEAGAGGVFTLLATAAAGSHFDGFTGCSSVTGTVCTLSFAGNDTTFDVGVTFTLNEGPPATNTVNLYNGAEISVYLVGPGEATTAGGLIAPHAERSIAIDDDGGKHRLLPGLQLDSHADRLRHLPGDCRRVDRRGRPTGRAQRLRGVLHDLR